MLSFIFESLGTSELILIGIVALIFLGPRKLPELAKKLGKIMSDLRSTTTEFKETWEREVNFDEEVKALKIKDLEAEVASSQRTGEEPGSVGAPEIKEIDATRFDGVGIDSGGDGSDQSSVANGDRDPVDDPEESGSDALAKQNWL